MHKLEVLNIVNSFDGLPVLDDISFTVEPGAFLSVVGPSGCGKSTLLNVISGLLPADSGEIRVDGETIAQNRSSKIAYMPQEGFLMPWFTALDNASLPLILSGAPKQKARARAKEYFEAFGLSGFEDAYPGELSGGMRQRAALTSVMLCERDILLLDEPFGALDALTRIKMQDWLKGVLKTLGRTVVMVTHDIPEALYLSDAIAVMSGRPARIAETLHSPRPDDRDWLLGQAAAGLHLRVYKALKT